MNSSYSITAAERTAVRLVAEFWTWGEYGRDYKWTLLDGMTSEWPFTCGVAIHSLTKSSYLCALKIPAKYQSSKFKYKQSECPLYISRCVYKFLTNNRLNLYAPLPGFQEGRFLECLKFISYAVLLFWEAVGTYQSNYQTLFFKKIFFMIRNKSQTLQCAINCCLTRLKP